MLPLAVGFWAMQARGVIWIVVAIAMVCGVVDLMRRPDLDGRQRAAWLLLILILPLIGTVMYFYLRPTLPEEGKRMFAVRESMRAGDGPGPLGR